MFGVLAGKLMGGRSGKDRKIVVGKERRQERGKKTQAGKTERLPCDFTDLCPSQDLGM